MSLSSDLFQVFKRPEQEEEDSPVFSLVDFSGKVWKSGIFFSPNKGIISEQKCSNIPECDEIPSSSY